MSLAPLSLELSAVGIERECNDLVRLLALDTECSPMQTPWMRTPYIMRSARKCLVGAHFVAAKILLCLIVRQRYVADDAVAQSNGRGERWGTDVETRYQGGTRDAGTQTRDAEM